MVQENIIKANLAAPEAYQLFEGTNNCLISTCQQQIISRSRIKTYYHQRIRCVVADMMSRNFTVSKWTLFNYKLVQFFS